MEDLFMRSGSDGLFSVMVMGTSDGTASLPLSVLLRREKKWLAMFTHWDNYMRRKYKTLRDRCRKGIPSTVRPRAWSYLCGGFMLKEKYPGRYETLCHIQGDARCEEDIKKDLHRTFPHHKMFVSSEGFGQQDLHFVLKAYSILNPRVGYCQAQAPLAGFLLIHMPAEEAFWCLVSICDKYLAGYYGQDMEILQLDGDILFGLLKKVSPSVHRHLRKQGLEPVLYMTEWFLCVFTRSLPWPTLLHLWDIFLCEGVKIIFKAALVIIKYTLEPRGVMKKCPTMYETLELLRSPPPHVVEENFLISHIFKMDITEEDFMKEHKKQEGKRREAKEKANVSKIV